MIKTLKVPIATGATVIGGVIIGDEVYKLEPIKKEEVTKNNNEKE